MLAPLFHLPPKSTARHVDCGAALPFGFRRQKIGQRFGLAEIDTAIGKGAPRKFAGLRRTQTSDLCQRTFHGPHNRASAMQMEFHQVFARRAVRSGKTEDHGLIQNRAIAAAQHLQRRRSRFRHATG